MVLTVIAILVAVYLGVGFFGRAPYRINAAANLRTDELTHLTAPFDGHIDKVRVRLGDNVKQGQELLSLDQTDLLLREADLVAEKVRYDREVEKAQGTGALADMRIAAALRDQSAARLELARYQLGEAVLRAPFDGTIVEGDLIDRIGSPVRQGEPLDKSWQPQQCLTFEEALHAYTVGAAYSAGCEAWLGRLSPGYAADLVMFSYDPKDTQKQDFYIIKPEATMVAGSWVWNASDLQL